MNVKELVKTLENAPADNAETRKEPVSSYLVFRVKESRYAIPSSEVKEIANDTTVYPLPFCPPYLRGLISVHGKPYAVYDIYTFLENKPTDIARFLILGRADDAISVACEEIEEILDVPDSGIQRFDEKTQQGTYFKGSFGNKDNHVFIVNSDALVRKLVNDLKR